LDSSVVFLLYESAGRIITQICKNIYAEPILCGLILI
jgi:hypothetical protein